MEKRGRATRRSRVTSIGALFFASVFLVLPPRAWSDPPLVTLDPSMVGKGSLEVIVASSGLREGGNTIYGMPILDLVYGISDRFDAGVVIEPVELIKDDRVTLDAMLIAAGCRWQFLAAGDVRASLTPSFTYDLRDASGVFLSLPVQLEYAAGDWRFGTDLGYTDVRSQNGFWLGGANGGWLVNDRMELRFEIWAAATDGSSSTQTGWSLGIDAAPAENVHVLAGGGSGIRSKHHESLDWRFYVGLQVAFPNLFRRSG